jgi:hypothetical protein
MCLRPLLATAGLLMLALLAGDVAGLRAADAVSPSRRAVMLVYVGAEDCAPCRTWRRGEWPVFRDSPAFDALAYREVVSPSLLDALKDEVWPMDLRRLRAGIPPGSGVPLWIVLADDTEVLRASGISQWKTDVLPTIWRLVRQPSRHGL